jgi:hypothetical protein
MSRLGKPRRRRVMAKESESSKAEADRWRDVIEAMQKKTMAPRRLPKEAPDKPKADRKSRETNAL